MADRRATRTPAGLPPAAAARHVEARDGFEVLFVHRDADGHRLRGHSTGFEEGVIWAVTYDITIDSFWITRSARVAARTAAGSQEVLIERDAGGVWRVDGQAVPELAGCMDVDLEASVFTNAFPVGRLGLQVGEAADAPAAYVRIPDLRVERLEQRYARLDDDGDRSRYDYASPAFDFYAVLVYDESGLIVDYPGLGVRIA